MITARTASILAALNAANTDTRVTWESSPRPAAAHKARVLVKRTTALVRAGVEYRALPEVAEAIAAGERGEPGSLPWGRWEVPGYVITHKGVEYVRFAPSSPRGMEVTYTVDGVEVDGDTFRSYLTPAAARKSEPPLVFTVKAESILKVGTVVLSA